jgi:hypothetical protein
VKSGILKQPNQGSSIENGTAENQNQGTKQTEQDDNNSHQRQVTFENKTTDTSRSTNSSLSRSVTNSKINSANKDIDAEIESLKNNFEQRMDKQDSRISELIEIIHEMNRSIEDRMKTAILHTLAYEKSKVEEITHGKIYKASDAPLADENGIYYHAA